MRRGPSKEELRERFIDKGIDFIYKIRIPKTNKYPGDVAGCLDNKGKKRSIDPRWAITVNCKKYYRYVLKWIYYNGDIPNNLVVEHIDKNQLNDDISNLRLATRLQDLRNRIATKRSTTGILGIGWDKSNNKYVANISNNGKGKSFRFKPEDLLLAILKRFQLEQEIDPIFYHNSDCAKLVREYDLIKRFN